MRQFSGCVGRDSFSLTVNRKSRGVVARQNTSGPSVFNIERASLDMLTDFVESRLCIRVLMLSKGIDAYLENDKVSTRPIQIVETSQVRGELTL